MAVCLLLMRLPAASAAFRLMIETNSGRDDTPAPGSGRARRVGTPVPTNRSETHVIHIRPLRLSHLVRAAPSVLCNVE
jgi:hypothetical protein